MSVLLLVTLLFNINLGYVYFEGPKTYAEAKAYCEFKGSTIATILDRGDRIAALSAIDGRESPYIGLEHVTDENGKCKFEFVNDADAACEDKYGFKCVRFWASGFPQYIRDGGNKCTIYDRTARQGSGGISNGIDCNTARAFLCNEDENGICNSEDFICRVTPWVWCGRNCFCDKDSNGDTQCMDTNVDSCGALPKCLLNSECPTDQYCTVTNCCNGGNMGRCVPLCPDNRKTTVRRRLEAEEDDDKPELLQCTVAFCKSDDPLCGGCS